MTTSFKFDLIKRLNTTNRKMTVRQDFFWMKAKTAVSSSEDIIIRRGIQETRINTSPLINPFYIDMHSFNIIPLGFENEQ